MVVTLGQQYNTGEKHTEIMLLVIGKEKIFTLYNESTEIFYDVFRFHTNSYLVHTWYVCTADDYNRNKYQQTDFLYYIVVNTSIILSSFGTLYQI